MDYICNVCETPFTASGNNRRSYCSDPCRNIARRVKRTKDYKEDSEYSAKLRAKGETEIEIDPKWLKRGTVSTNNRNSYIGG